MLNDQSKDTISKKNGITYTFKDIEEKKPDKEKYEIIFDDGEEYFFPKFVDKEKFRRVCLNKFSNLIFSSNYEEGNFKYLNNSLISAIVFAYNNHIPLVIRPDDIWTCVIVTLGLYINTFNSEMKDIFTDKEKTELKYISESNNLKESIKDFIDDISKQINKNIKNDFAEWIIPDFSTTTSTDKMVAKIVFMSSVKEYFTYTLNLHCGISKLTLEGTLGDWVLLKNKIKKIHEFNRKDLSQWIDVLEYVLDKFIDFYHGKVDEDFFQRIVSDKRNGSSPSKKIKGWALVFCPFDIKCKLVLNDFKTIMETNVYGKVYDCKVPVCYIDSEIKLENSKNTFKIVAGLIFANIMKQRMKLKLNQIILL